MPRHGRVVFAGVGIHVVQRGHNRSACFFGPSDYLAYLRFLETFAERCGCDIHAYCLMTNHVHLFLTPRTPESCAILMKNVGQHYAQYLNRTRRRTGSPWEGRFWSCLVPGDRYALACYRYIELNPVRAGLVAQPLDYTWSSFRANAGHRRDSLLRPHPSYSSLCEDDQRRKMQYSRLLATQMDTITVEEIRRATRNGRALGAATPKRGRPRKSGSVPLFQNFLVS